MLLQQASNWLITIWSNPKRHEMLDTMPLNTLSFLQPLSSSSLSSPNHSTGITQVAPQPDETFQSGTMKDIMNPETLLKAYKFLVCWLLQSSSEKFHSNLQAGKDAFMARNDSQVYGARTLAIAFFEHYALERFWNFCSPKQQQQHGYHHQNAPRGAEAELPADIRKVLTNLFLLYGYWSLEKHLATLYQCGYLRGPRGAELIRQAILELCSALKNEAVALVDAISPPDFILNSALGKSNGMVYKNLYLAMSQTPGAFERSSDWKGIAKRLKANL